MTKSVTKEEMLEKIKECAATLGYAPSLPELEKRTGMRKWNLYKYFPSYQYALRICELRRRGGGHSLATGDRFVTWAQVVRTLKKVPSAREYEEHSKQDKRVMLRWVGVWSHTPQRMLEYIQLERLESEWKDVYEVILKHFDPRRRDEKYIAEPLVRPSEETRQVHSEAHSEGPFEASFGQMERPDCRGLAMPDKPVYGRPLLRAPLNCAPINELGVVFLFGAVARELGFMVTRLQAAFPDCEAFRQVEPDRWQKVLIEFEFESRNFLAHGHDIEDCDLIVCWRHNWEGCPMEVIELRSLKCMQI
ncbi:MAG TPA: hypothetical protein VGK22_18490 [Candidatus Angelobacter sp.]